MIRTKLKCYILFLTICAVEGLLHMPTAYTRPAGLQRVNGSDPFGGCPQTPVNCSITEGSGVGVCQCDGDTATNGTLIDEEIQPIDPVSDMDSWSSELFTVNRNGQSSIVIGFDFLSLFTLREVEMKLFNCPAWNIAASTINVYGSLQFPIFNPSFSSIGGSVNIDTIQDCSSLSTVTIPVQLTTARRIYFIEMTFNGVPSAEWAPSIAEIQFSNETLTEPPTEPPVTEPTTTTRSTTPEATSLSTGTATEITTATQDTTATTTTSPEYTTEDISDIATNHGGFPTPNTELLWILIVLVIPFAAVILIILCVLAFAVRKDKRCTCCAGNDKPQEIEMT